MRFLLAILLAFAPLAQAKPRKTSATVTKKKSDDKPPPPGDKSQNEGAQGRQNATEDAARASDSAQFEGRP
jgi:hypothetical protein